LGIEDGADALIMLHAHRVSIYEASMCKRSIRMRAVRAMIDGLQGAYGCY
jgi:hypothetical protein